MSQLKIWHFLNYWCRKKISGALLTGIVSQLKIWYFLSYWYRKKFSGAPLTGIVSQLKIWYFLSYWYRKKIFRCTFNRQSVTTQNLAFFLVIRIERNVCRLTFNRHSVITQFVKVAAGEQLCRCCTQIKYSTSKPLSLSPEKPLILSCDTVVANERYDIALNSILIVSSQLYLFNFPTIISVASIISSKFATRQRRPTLLDFFHLITFHSLINADQLRGI